MKIENLNKDYNTKFDTFFYELNKQNKMNFSKEDFPPLGASGEQKSPPKNHSSKNDSEKSVLQPADRVFQCLMCNKEGPAGSVIRFKDRLHMIYVREGFVCRL